MATSSYSGRSFSGRPMVSLGLMLALAACSTDVLEPPARMSGVSPVSRPVSREERVANYPVREEPMSQAAQAAMSPIPEEGVDIDGMVTAAPVVGLAEEQSRDIHGGTGAHVGQAGGQSAPGVQTTPAGPVLVDGIGTNSVHVLSVPARAGAATAPAASPEGDPDLPPLTPERMDMEARRKAQFLEQEQSLPAGQRGTAGRRETSGQRARVREEQVAFLPRAGNPVDVLSESEPEPQRGATMPASEIACRKRLTKLGVSFADVPRISNGPSCGIDYPIQLSGLSGGINVKPAVKLNCEVTEAFALWVKNELAPSARYRYLTGIGTIKPLGGYSCRTMNSRRGAAMSEHAHGNAIDVGKFVLKNGKEIDVRKPGFFAFREKGLLKAVRQDSCKYFNTVLGPGSDPFHKDHFHFDLRNRKSGYRHCT